MNQGPSPLSDALYGREGDLGAFPGLQPGAEGFGTDGASARAAPTGSELYRHQGCVPGEQLAARPAAKYEVFVRIRLRHVHLLFIWTETTAWVCPSKDGWSLG